MINCPQCNSENTQSFPMIYSAATTTGEFKAAPDEFDPAATGTMSKNKHQIRLVRQVAPPPVPIFTNGQIALAMAAFFGVSLILTTLIPYVTIISFFLGLAASGGVLYYFNKKLLPKKIEWQEKILAWDNSWMCFKCGANWQHRQIQNGTDEPEAKAISHSV